MKIGMVCYPSHGGSGTIATELGKALGIRGHQVHFISYSIPYRLREYNENVCFHEVNMMKYPLFEYPPYSLALSVKMAELIEKEKLDLLHVHYAIPHSTSAYLAKQMVNGNVKVITSLHGTDITIVGSDESYYKINKFSIERSDGITTVSEFLKREAKEKFHLDKPIKVIPNFVDTNLFTKTHRCRAKCLFAPKGERIIMHVSNFRPIKRIEDVISAFKLIHDEIPSKLLMVGDGPMMSSALRLVEKLEISSSVTFLGKQDDVAGLLPNADLFLIPSEMESFGLSALEAMSCEVPVIATNVGGLPEVIEHGKTGFLVDVGDIEAMAELAKKLLKDDELHDKMGKSARQTVLERFNQDKIVSMYEDYYKEIGGVLW
ncbi:TPA: N-acetyl-alpha-D-glucosaminyl L-malate synthase BshA [Candidatus Poribacteria bacterium]|nr:N-acetyl-alpha-D-glucosaminyl L-malate synthase BshA [Candidatus Poribacteria bacterium]